MSFTEKCLFISFALILLECDINLFHVDLWELSKYCPFAATYIVCFPSLCSEYLGMVRFASWMLKIMTSSEIYTLLGSDKLYSYVLNFTSFP